MGGMSSTPSICQCPSNQVHDVTAHIITQRFKDNDQLR